MLAAQVRRDHVQRLVTSPCQFPLFGLLARVSNNLEDLLVVVGCDAVLGLRLDIKPKVELLLPAVASLSMSSTAEAQL